MNINPPPPKKCHRLTQINISTPARFIFFKKKRVLEDSAAHELVNAITAADRGSGELATPWLLLLFQHVWLLFQLA